jgi:hypothetical protein
MVIFARVYLATNNHPLLAAHRPATASSYRQIHREDRPDEKIVTSLPKVGKSRAPLTERLRGPDDRASA